MKLTRLEWDSKHFGFLVGRVEGAESGADDLAGLLESGRRRGLRLVYWTADAGREPSAELLARFGGRLVDRRVIFTRELCEADAGWSPEGTDCRVVEWPRGAAGPELTVLAVEASAYSRFRTDPRMAPGRCDELYRIWIERSARGELADVVHVALDARGDLAGLVTAQVTGDLAHIGLVAVGRRRRGQGVGSLLLRTSLAWMSCGGARRAQVATQRANTGARRLYEGVGFAVSAERPVFHFWMMETETHT